MQVDHTKLLLVLQRCITAAKDEQGSVPFAEYRGSVTSTQTTAAFIAGLIAHETGADLGTMFEMLDIPFDKKRIALVADTIKEIFPQSKH